MFKAGKKRQKTLLVEDKNIIKKTYIHNTFNYLRIQLYSYKFRQKANIKNIVYFVDI